jgi:hypothetical protein
VNNTTGDPPHLSGLKARFLITNDERQFSFQKQTHLFMRMTVRFHNRMGFKFDEGKHQVVTESRKNIDTRKNVMARTILTVHNVLRQVKSPVWIMTAQLQQWIPTAHKCIGFGSGHKADRPVKRIHHQVVYNPTYLQTSAVDADNPESDDRVP